MNGIHIGLDIGGTKLMVASADASGEIIKQETRPTPLPLEGGLAAIHEMIDSVRDGNRVMSIGAAAGGPMDFRSGVISPLHQPNWNDVPIKAIMEERWNCPFAIDIDTNIGALGEYRYGNWDASRFIYLTLSTGMGGGFLVDGKIVRGNNDSHPEAGHQSIPYRCSHPERIQCDCGSPNCLEAIISGRGIRRVYQKAPEELSAAEWEEVAYNLGQGLRNLTVLFAPDVIVLGGGIAFGQGENLLGPARQVLADHCKLVPIPKVAVSQLGYDTALMGCIAVAIHGL